MTYVFRIPHFMIAYTTCHAISKLTLQIVEGIILLDCARALVPCESVRDRSSPTPIQRSPAVQACAGVSTFVPSLAGPLLPPSSYVRCELSSTHYQLCPVVILVSFSLQPPRLRLAPSLSRHIDCIRLLPTRCAAEPGYDAARTLSRTVVRI
jgi:hypothetical protein